MNRRFRVLTCCLALVSITACGGGGCGRKASPGVPEPATPAAVPATAPGTPSPAPATPLAALDALVTRIPVQATSVGVFPASRIHAALASLSAGVPRLAYALTADDFRARLRTLYGVDLTGVDGTCAFADLEPSGPLVICPGGSLVEVKGSYRWTHGAASGHNVTRNGLEVSLAVIDGHLTVGTLESVRRAVLVSQGAWPRLSDARERWMPAFVESAGIDALGHSALFFLDPAAAPWCGDTCMSSAVFASDDEVLAVARATTKLGPALEARATAWWKGVGTALAELQAQPEGERPLRMPDAWLKAADLLTRSGTLRLRDDHLVFEGKGDALVLLLALEPEGPRRLLSEMPAATATTPGTP